MITEAKCSFKIDLVGKPFYPVRGYAIDKTV
jgi:hypothetical protein